MKKKLAIVSSVLLFAISIATNVFAQWKPVGLQGTGQSHSVYCVARNGSNLFAGTGNRGFQHSSDDGVNWTPSNGLSNNKVNTFASIGSNLFVGTDTAGIFISTDNGMNWTSLQGMANSYPVYSLVVSDSAIFAGTIGDGVFRSNDLGKTWIPANTGAKSMRIYTLFVSGTTLLSGSERNGISLSTNMGVTWDSVSGDGIVDAFTSSGSIFYAATRAQNSNRDGSVYRSNDFGRTWKSLDTGSFSEYGNIYSLAAKDGNVFAGLYSDIHTHGGLLNRSIDSGASWIGASEGLIGDPVYSLVIIGDTLYAGTANGIWRRPLSEFMTIFGRINAPDLHFDDTKIGDTECKTIAIHNTGNGPFTLLSYSIDTIDMWNKDFSVDTSQLPAQIKPGDSLNIKVCFHPHTLELDYPQVIWETDITPELKGVGKYYTVLYGTGAQNSEVSVMKDAPIILTPNPTKGIMTITNAPDNLISVSVLNVLGESVLELAHPNAPDLKLDLSKLPTGTYFAMFSLANEVITRKIIKE